MTSRTMREVASMSTSTLRVFERWLDTLPLWLFSELRKAVKSELLARDLPLIAEESGGYPCAAIGGTH